MSACGSSLLYNMSLTSLHPTLPQDRYGWPLPEWKGDPRLDPVRKLKSRFHDQVREEQARMKALADKGHAYNYVTAAV